LLQVIIVDDEELAIERLERILRELDDTFFISVFLTSNDAYEYAKTNKVDVAFLDISMPKINGMMLADSLKELNEDMNIIFVTGYSEFAVQAFQIHALDYVMKPVKKDRLKTTVERIKKQMKYEVHKVTLEVDLFNDLSIRISQGNKKREEIRLRSPKTEELFAFLVYKRTATREEIIEALWPNMLPQKALKNLNSNLYYIRKAFTGTNDHLIKTTGDEIKIEAEHIHCDLYEFEDIMKQLKSEMKMSELLIRKLEGVYLGSFLRGKPYNWSTVQARIFEQQYIERLDAAASFLYEQGNLQQALYYYNELLKLDPMREDIHYKVIRLYLELGRKYAAVQHYHELKKLLLEELGTTPDSDVEAMLQ